MGYSLEAKHLIWVWIMKVKGPKNQVDFIEVLYVVVNLHINLLGPVTPQFSPLIMEKTVSGLPTISIITLPLVETCFMNSVWKLLQLMGTYHCCRCLKYTSRLHVMK